MKKALLFAGAVLVLAACDSATAPSGLSRHDGNVAAVKDSTKKPGATTNTLSTGTLSETCGWTRPIGSTDSVWLGDCIQQQ